MSRRKQGRPQQRRTLDSLEQENDLLVCGECQTSFPLRDILKFIRHKINRCNKDSGDPDTVDSNDEDPETPELSGIGLKCPSISAPISRKETIETRLSPLLESNDDVKESNDLTPDEDVKPLRPPLKLKQGVDAESNTTSSEPTKFVCESCKATHESAWSLLQHAQREHGMKIYHTQPEHSAISKNPDVTMKEYNDSKRSPHLPQTSKLHHDDPRDHPLHVHREHHRTPPSACSSAGSGEATVITSHHSPNPFMFRFPFERPPPLSPGLSFNRPPGPDFISSEPPRHLGLLNFPHIDGPSPPFPHLFDRNPRPVGFDNKTLESYYSQRLRELASRDMISCPPAGSPPVRKHTPPFSQAGTTTTSLFSPLTSQQASPHPTELDRSQRPGSLTPPNKLKSCEFCGKSFRFQSNLIVHRRSHTGEKPFKCPLCPHACTQQSKLKRHMKTHMNKSPMMSQISNSSDGGNHGSGESTPEGIKKFMEEDEDDEEEEMEDEEEEIEETEMEEEFSDSRKVSNNNLEKKPEISIFSPSVIPPHSRNGSLSINSIQDKSSLLKEVMENTGLTRIPTYKDALKQAMEENFKEHPENEPIKELQENGSRNGSISSRDDIKSEPESNQWNGTESKASNGESDSVQAKPVKNEPLEAAPTPIFNFDMFSSLSQSLWRMPLSNPPPEIYPLIGGYPFDPNHNNGFNPVTSVDSALKTYNTQKSTDNISSTNSSPLPRKESKRNDTCEYCGKIFRNCSNLTVHRRSHTGEKPYKCALCSYACAQSSKLTRHMRTHGRIGKDVYRCKFCSMPFSVASTLEKHMRKCVGNGQINKMLADSDSQPEGSRMMPDSESDSSNLNAYDSTNTATTPTSVYDSNSLTKNIYDSPTTATSMFETVKSSTSLFNSTNVATSLYESSKVPTSPFDSAKVSGSLVKRESGLFDSVNAAPTI